MIRKNDAFGGWRERKPEQTRRSNDRKASQTRSRKRRLTYGHDWTPWTMRAVAFELHIRVGAIRECVVCGKQEQRIFAMSRDGFQQFIADSPLERPKTLQVRS